MALNGLAVDLQTPGDTACRPSGLYVLRTPGLSSRPHGSNPYRGSLKGECVTRGLRRCLPTVCTYPRRLRWLPQVHAIACAKAESRGTKGASPHADKREVCDRPGGLPHLPSCRPGDPPPPDRTCLCYPGFRQRAGLHAMCKPNPKGTTRGKPKNRSHRPEPVRR